MRFKKLTLSCGGDLCPLRALEIDPSAPTLSASLLLSCFYCGQVLKRNRETHTRTMWTKAKDSALKNRASTSEMLGNTARTSLAVDDTAQFRDQLHQLRQENAALKEALEEVRIWVSFFAISATQIIHKTKILQTNIHNTSSNTKKNRKKHN